MSPVQGKSTPVQVKEPYGNLDMVTVGFHPATRSVQCTPADNTRKRVWQYIEKKKKANIIEKEEIPPERMSISEKKKCMNNWYSRINGLPVIFGVSAMHGGFHGQTLRTALPPLHPQNS